MAVTHLTVVVAAVPINHRASDGRGADLISVSCCWIDSVKINILLPYAKIWLMLMLMLKYCERK